MFQFTAGREYFLTSTICDECIVGKKVFETIVNEFITLSASIQYRTYLLRICIRYILNGTPKKRFLKFISIQGHTGITIADYRGQEYGRTCCRATSSNIRR